MVNQMLDDDNLKETLQAFLLKSKGPGSSSGRIEMGPPDLDKNSILKY